MLLLILLVDAAGLSPDRPAGCVLWPAALKGDARGLGTLLPLLLLWLLLLLWPAPLGKDA
jgi:hypothetical protein